MNNKEELIATIKRISGVNTRKCMKCGQIEKLANSNGIWNCLTCFACLERCPRQVEPAKLIEAVRLAVIRQQGMNHLKPEQIPELLDEELPQQAITTAFRKFAK